MRDFVVAKVVNRQAYTHGWFILFADTERSDNFDLSQATRGFPVDRALQPYPAYCCGPPSGGAPVTPGFGGSMAQLFDAEGQRKYVCGGEWRRFLAATDRMDASTRAFCYLLAFTGCRISEGLALTPQRLDAETGRVIFLTLKRRARVFRAVPIPPDLMTALAKLARGKPADAPLWGWCRVTAWRRVKTVMDAAGITGAQATAKGLRHGFGIANAEQNVPAALTQRWMGHARLETTAIYQHAIGEEERAFAKRLWRRLPHSELR